MQPTNNLRFIEREVTEFVDGYTGGFEICRKVKRRVLQQWWACDPDSLMDWTLKTNGEWCDVPLEAAGE